RGQRAAAARAHADAADLHAGDRASGTRGRRRGAGPGRWRRARRHARRPAPAVRARAQDGGAGGPGAFRHAGARRETHGTLAGRRVLRLFRLTHRHAMELSQIFTIAAKELRDRMRNRWVLAVAIVFTVFSLVIAYFGGAQQGQVGFRSIEFTIASLVSLVIYLIPL